MKLGDEAWQLPQPEEKGVLLNTLLVLLDVLLTHIFIPVIALAMDRAQITWQHAFQAASHDFYGFPTFTLLYSYRVPMEPTVSFGFTYMQIWKCMLNTANPN